MPDQEKARARREVFKSLFSVVKSNDGIIRFFFATGVSKFSKVSLFSDLNNAEDITLAPQYSALLGVTEEEIVRVLSSFVEKAAVELKSSRETLIREMKEWFDGYSWDGKTFLFNPSSLFSFLKQHRFVNFWLSTGTPSFLISLLTERLDLVFDEHEVYETAFDSLDIEGSNTFGLLFQSGYLTLKKPMQNRIATLGFPNKEVRQSFLDHIAVRLEQKTLRQL